jgi:protein TonB
MYADNYHAKERLRAGIPALVIHLCLLLAIARGLGLALPPPAPQPLQLIEVPPSLPPPPRERPTPRERARRAEGAAAPANLEARPTEVVAPPRVIPQPAPPIAAAPVAGPGTKPFSGAAPVPGPGTGAGGQGNGTGSGGFGNGPGGGGEGRGTPPRQIRGEISDHDWPSRAAQAAGGGTVSVIYTVETDGRATHCEITHSSGSEELDDTTCRLIEQRFRFEPSRDRSGQPIRSTIVQDHEWVVERVERQAQDEPESRPRRRWPF